jgi:hypothetical protein
VEEIVDNARSSGIDNTPFQPLSSNGGEISGIFNHREFSSSPLSALGEGKEFLWSAAWGLIL